MKNNVLSRRREPIVLGGGYVGFAASAAAEQNGRVGTDYI
jgi:hypothetical protein